MNNQELTPEQLDRQTRVSVARGKLALIEEQRAVALATLKALQDYCDHGSKFERYCCGKPEGMKCAICGKTWD